MFSHLQLIWPFHNENIVYKRLSSRKRVEYFLLLHIVGNGKFWLENGQWLTGILNSGHRNDHHGNNPGELKSLEWVKQQLNSPKW